MEEIIRAIADLNNSGEVVFLQLETHEILSYPAPEQSGYNEFDYLAEEVLAITDAHPERYLRFDPPDTRTSYQIMVGFAESVANEALKAHLLDALQSKKPFRNFRNALQPEAVEDDWYDYRDAFLQMSVRDKL